MLPGAFFHSNVPRGEMDNANCFIKALHTFMKVFKEERPEMRAVEEFFRWDNMRSRTQQRL
jgi:hypothetical protein